MMDNDFELDAGGAPHVFYPQLAINLGMRSATIFEGACPIFLKSIVH